MSSPARLGTRCILVVAFVFLSVGTWADPQTESPPWVRQGATLEMLHQESSVAPRVRFNDGIPITVSIRLPVPPEFAKDPVLGALYYFDRYRDLYLLQSPRQQLFLHRIVESDNGTSLFFG